MIRIGQQFQEERKRQNLTLEEISKATKIRVEFLTAIEKGDFDALPSSAYAAGFVRNYAKYLGLPVEKSLAIYRREYDESKAQELLPKGLSDPSQFSGSKYKFGRSGIIIAAVLALLSLFLVYQYRSALFDPGLKVDSPKENEVVNSATVEVRGKTDPNGTLLIEGEAVSINPDGSFRKEITVFPGESSFTLKVTNRFGRETELIRNIVVRGD
jgi:cytoskeletal protein RodZ